MTSAWLLLAKARMPGHWFQILSFTGKILSSQDPVARLLRSNPGFSPARHPRELFQDGIGRLLLFIRAAGRRPRANNAFTERVKCSGRQQQANSH